MKTNLSYTDCPTSSDEASPCIGCPEYWDCFNAIADSDASMSGCLRPDRLCKIGVPTDAQKN